MLMGARPTIGESCYQHAFTTVNPTRSRTLVITAAMKKRPPAQRSAGKQQAPQRGGQKRSATPQRGLGGLFGGAKKAASNVKKAPVKPKQVAKKAASQVKKAAPLPIGTRRAGGSQKIGGTKRVGTKQVGGTSRIGTKRTGAPAPARPGRIQFSEDTSSTLGAVSVFGLGLAASAFLLFSALTGIEAPAEAEQVLQNASSSIKSAVQEVATVAAKGAGEQEDSKVADLAKKAQDKASEVPSEARSTPSPKVADASPTGQAGIFGFGGQKPSAAEDSQVPSVTQGAKDAVEGKNPTPTPTSTQPAKQASNEVAKVAEGPAEQAAEAVRTLVPSPDGLVDAEKAAQNAESQEKRAVDAPEESFKAASPVGGQGEVSNLADQGLKGGKAFEEAAAKLKGSSAEQFQKATEVDKQLQAEDDFKRASQFRAESPGSGSGNSVIGRSEKQITRSGNDKPEQLSASFSVGGGSSGGKVATPSAPAAPGNTNLLIGGGVVVLGLIAAAASQGGGGAIQEQAGKAAESVKQEASSGGSGDIKDDIANRKKDARQWIDDWKSRTGGN